MSFSPGLAARSILTLAIFVAPVALAQEDDPLVSDRPDFTESAVTVAPGRVQVEAGATHTETGDSESQEIGEVLVRIGVARRLELRLGLNSWTRVDAPGRADVSGLVDASVGAKLALGETLGWTTAVLLGTTLPTGSSELRAPDPQPGVVLAAQRDLTGAVSVGANLGYSYASAGGARFGETVASVALGVGVAEATGVFFELYGTVPASAGGPETYYFDTGATYGFGPDLQVDLRVGFGLNSAADDFFAGAGLVWRR